MKEFYNLKAVITHGVLLDQAFAHCPIFPTAASWWSLGRISVPVWPDTLSGRLPVVALVGHHPTNKLIGRGPIPHRKSFPPQTMQSGVLFGIRPSFPGLSQSAGQITHVLLTRSPLEYPRRGLSVRLACVKHAASVRSEPGSNSPVCSLNSCSNKWARSVEPTCYSCCWFSYSRLLCFIFELDFTSISFNLWFQRVNHCIVIFFLSDFKKLTFKLL